AFSFTGKNVEELKELTYANFDIGLAVTAAVVDETRDPEVDCEKLGYRVRDWLAVCLSTYLSALNILDEEKPDRVDVINGRLAYTRAILRACQAKGIDCFVHDFAGDYTRYWIMPNAMPHEIMPYHASIEEVWARAAPGEREAIGCKYFEDKAKGKEW